MGKGSGVAPDVVQMLEGQHAAIRRGFRRAMLPGPPGRRAFADLRRLLAVHEAAEEAHVHPVVRKTVDGGRRLVKSRLQEEKAAKKLLREAERIGPGGRGYRVALRRLRRAVLAHAAREEHEEFPVLRVHVRGLRRRSLGLESKVTQAVAPTHPHPWVNTQLANKLTAPVAGPLDRGRDLVGRLVHR